MDLETCHLRVMDLLLQLVWVYIRWDSEETLEAAERLSETLLKSYGRLYGPLHPKRLNAIQSVAELHCRCGRLLEAEAEFARVVEGISQVLGDDHIDTATARFNLASVYVNQNPWADARETLENVARELKRILGTKHPYVHDGLIALGEVYHLQGQLDMVGKAFQEALTIAKQMTNGQQKVVDAVWWLQHIQEMRTNKGVCWHMPEADGSGQEHAISGEERSTERLPWHQRPERSPSHRRNIRRRCIKL